MARIDKRRTAGWQYLHIAIDDHTRLAYSEILDDETGRRLWCRHVRLLEGSRDCIRALLEDHPDRS